MALGLEKKSPPENVRKRPENGSGSLKITMDEKFLKRNQPRKSQTPSGNPEKRETALVLDKKSHPCKGNFRKTSGNGSGS